MSAAHVQTQFASTGSNVETMSVSITMTTGNAVIVTIVANSSKAGLSGLTQTAGDTLTMTAEIDNASTYMAQYINHSVAGGSTTFTFTWTGATGFGIFATEVSGLKTSSAFDVSASTNQTTSTTHSSGTTGTLSQSDEFALASFNGDGSGGTTISGMSNGFTVPTNGEQLSGGNFIRGAVAYKVLSATNGVETTMTTNDNEAATGLMATYKAAAAAPATLTVGLAEPVMGSSLFM